jgi:hypothetical protein
VQRGCHLHPWRNTRGDSDSAIIADVAIYWSFESLFSPSWNGNDLADFSCDFAPIGRIKNIVRTFIEHKIPFTIITEKQLNRLTDFRALVLPAVAMMSAAEARAIEKFVKNGGRVYASGETSLYDKTGARQKDFQLGHVFGISYLDGRTKEKVTYICPNVSGDSFLSGCSKKYPLMIEDDQMIVKARKMGNALGTLALPYTDPDDKDLFASAISNPPGKYTKYPALVSNHYGKGGAIYCAGGLENMAHEKHRQVFAGLIKAFLPERAFETDAPKPVEIILFRHKQKKRLIINVLNYQKHVPPVPVHDMILRVNTGKQTPIALTRARDGRKIEYKLKDAGMVEFKIDRIDMFAMFILEYK